LQKCEIGFILSACPINPVWPDLTNLHSARRAESPYYFTMGRPFSPKNLPLPIRGSEPPSNTWSLGLTQVLNLNGISIGSAVFAGLTSVTDRPTDRPRYSVCSNRPHLRT